MRTIVHGVALALLTLVACKTAPTGPTSAGPTTATSCPPCECKCSGGGVDNRAEIAALSRSATKKANQRDGAGCLADLAALEKLDPVSGDLYKYTRAQCTMLAGRCDAGKELAREVFRDSVGASMGPEQVERSVESYAAMYCEGQMSDRDAVLRSIQALNRGAYLESMSSEFCEEHHRAIEQRRGGVKPRDVDDTQISEIDRLLAHAVPSCYARAGDCARAWTLYRTLQMKADSHWAKMDPALREKTMRSSFESVVRRCAPTPARTSP